MVVLTDKQYRELPQCRHVQRFVKGTLVDGAIAKKAHGHFRQSAQHNAEAPITQRVVYNAYQHIQSAASLCQLSSISG